MAHALATLKTLAEALGLCGSCTHRLTSDGAVSEPVAAPVMQPVVGPRRLSTFTYIAATLNNVSFEESSLEKLTVKDCDWQNVSFIHCKLDNVRFTKSTLRNVCFENMDFTDLRFVGLNLDNMVWKNQTLRHAVITDRSWACSKTDPGTFTILLKVNKQSKTKLSTRKSIEEASISNRINAAKESLRILKASRIRKRTLPELPSRVLEKVMVALYDKTMVVFEEFPLDIVARLMDPRSVEHQTTSPKSAALRDLHLERKTYIRSAGKLDICVALLQVNKACYKLAVKHLYDRRFAFLDSPESCLAFLHDHRKEEHRIQQLLLTYKVDKTSRNTVVSNETATSLPSWRRLFNVLVHERTDVRDVGLIVDSRFWDEAPWKIGVSAVLTWKWGLADGAEMRPNFLHHMARLSPKVDTTLFIREAGAAPARKAFVETLHAHIKTKMKDRPTYAKARYGVCKEKKLEECCYWKWWEHV